MRKLILLSLFLVILTVSSAKSIKYSNSYGSFEVNPETSIGLIGQVQEINITAYKAGKYDFYFVFNEKIKRQLIEKAGVQDFVIQAPLIIIGCCDLEKISWYGKRGENLYSICDVSASIENLMLLATEKGLGTCWVGTFDERKVSKILNLPKNLRPIAIIPVGWPTEKPPTTQKVFKKEAIEEIK